MDFLTSQKNGGNVAFVFFNAIKVDQSTTAHKIKLDDH